MQIFFAHTFFVIIENLHKIFLKIISMRIRAEWFLGYRWKAEAQRDAVCSLRLYEKSVEKHLTECQISIMI